MHDLAVRPGTKYPLLRSDLEILRVGPDTFLLVDPVSHARFRISDGERYLSQLLDGHHSIADLREAYRERFGLRLSRRQIREFLYQVALHGLLEGSEESAAAVAGEDLPLADEIPQDLEIKPPSAPAETSRIERLNHRFDKLVLLFGWLIHPIWVPAVLALAVFAVVQFAPHTKQYLRDLRRLAHGYSILPLLLISFTQTILFMNVPREVVIGIACRKYGGRIWGFRLHFAGRFIPFFRCDARHSVVLMGRRGRWSLLTAGLLAQIAIGSIAALGWLNTDRGLLHTFWLILLPPCTLATLMHLNVLAAFDGYAILGYILKAPRLRERSMAEARASLALRTSPEPLPPSSRSWMRAYGLACYVWKIGVRVALILTIGWWLDERMGGAGVLAGFLLLCWIYQRPIRRFLMRNETLRSLSVRGGAWYIRWPLRLIILAGIVACGFIPYNYEIGGECRLIPHEERGLRAQIADEIKTVEVAEGDWVQPGQVIATLAAREERAAVETTKAQLDHAQARLDLLRAGPRPETISAAAHEVEFWEVELRFFDFEAARLENLGIQDAATKVELERTRRSRDASREKMSSAQEELKRLQQGTRPEQIREAEAEVARLKAELAHAQEMYDLHVIKAPIAGRVVTFNLRQRLGQAVSPGDLIAVIQDTSRLQAEIAADEAAGLHVNPGKPVNVRLWGNNGDLLTGRVSDISTPTMNYEQYSIDRFRTDREEQFQQVRRQAYEDWRYVRICADLDHPTEHLKPGMTGYANVTIDRDLLWRVVYRDVLRFIKVEVWSWLP